MCSLVYKCVLADVNIEHSRVHIKLLVLIMHVTVEVINRKYLHLIYHSYYTVQIDLEIAETNQLPDIYMQKNYHTTHISVQYVIDIITFAV